MRDQLAERLNVSAELRTLKDFQRRTARYADRRLWAKRGTGRFLVADEVGLGKTLVARGVIALAAARLQRAGDRRIDVVYVSSNSAIAAQNVRKLAVGGATVHQRTDRLATLPFHLPALNANEMNLVALTPGTSFEPRSRTGTFTERVACFQALRAIWPTKNFDSAGALRLCYAGISDASPPAARRAVRAKRDELGPFPANLRKALRAAVSALDARRKEHGLAPLAREFDELVAAFQRPSKSRAAELVRRRSAFIGDLRHVMATVAVSALHPDLVILDEFQRFKTLLGTDDSGDFAQSIAGHLFGYHQDDTGRDTRVLLLSATPYTMHTTAAHALAGQDSHYDDFMATYRFLVRDAPGEKKRLRDELGELRDALLAVPTAGIEPAQVAANAVASRLLEVMCRTERLAATDNRDGMLTTVADRVPIPDRGSYLQYADAATLALRLDEPDVIEYWKSAPYPISFLGGHEYAITRTLRDRLHDSPDLAALVNTSRAVLARDKIRSYRAIATANPRLSALQHDMVDSGAWQLLWIPASLPYYDGGSDFDADWARRLTKRLVFSSWTMVPTLIATMLSYQVERQVIGGISQPPRYDDPTNKRVIRKLQWRIRDNQPQAMTVLPLVAPSITIAEACDPLALAIQLRRNGNHAPTLGDVFTLARSRIEPMLITYIRQRSEQRGGDTRFWYWALPFQLDADRYLPPPADTISDAEERRGIGAHLGALQAARERLTHQHASADDLPPVPPDLTDVITEIALASPANCAYRALARQFPDATAQDLADAAASIGEGFRTLFNSFEATRLLDKSDDTDVYWRRVLEYCLRGNLQAVLDEYVHVLAEWRGYDRAAKRDPARAVLDLAHDVVTAVSLRPATYQVAVRPWRDDRGASMRGRYAARFGDASSEDGADQRREALTIAFNSPFWPFVLATTSVGQEGLDFHLYCHSVVHWNLPHNPVDLEQREGRVHRYKGHAIRKNVAVAAGFPASARGPWTELFDRAADIAGDVQGGIVPYWVYPTVHGARIERRFSIIPFSREASRLPDLLRSTAYYRLAFGQPRQDELIEHVLHGLPDQLAAGLRTLRVDLTPPK